MIGDTSFGLMLLAPRRLVGGRWRYVWKCRIGAALGVVGVLCSLLSHLSTDAQAQAPLQTIDAANTTIAGAVANRSAAKPKPPRQDANSTAVPELAAAADSDARSPETAASITLPTRVLSRAEVVASNSARLARMGHHVIIGYHVFAQAKSLVERRAIAGVFITDHNARGRSAAALKGEIDSLQAIRKAQGLQPLIIAADQEGGAVSRLSPPLQRQQSLGQLIAKLPNDTVRKSAVEAYASLQAEQLRRLGVTVNFAPVVDLNLNPKNRRDGETQLRSRAIDDEPFLVAKVAGWYCATLAKSGIMCTLKHFPGLGRVSRDTHVVTGEISASEGQLELNDWVPFRRLMDKPYIATMLGHVRVGSIDKSTPASYSKVIITDLIRKRWKHQGLLITDDFSMGAITRSHDRVGGAAIKALQAGADLVLVSFSEKHYDAVMSALLDADEKSLFDGDMRAASLARIVSATSKSPAESLAKSN